MFTHDCTKKNFACDICPFNPKDCGTFPQLGKPIFNNFSFNLAIKMVNGEFKKVVDEFNIEWDLSDWNQIWLNSKTVDIIPK